MFFIILRCTSVAVEHLQLWSSICQESLVSIAVVMWQLGRDHATMNSFPLSSHFTSAVVLETTFKIYYSAVREGGTVTISGFKISCVGTQESNSKPSGKW